MGDEKNEVKVNVPSRFQFDLDLSPLDRWELIFDYFKPKLSPLKKELEKLLDSMGVNNFFISGALKGLTKLAKSRQMIMFQTELEYIAMRMSLPFERILLLQLIFEANAMCTSVITKDYKHFRTMDWDMDLLRDITIELEVTKGGKVLYRAVTWLGYVGILTAVSSLHFSIAINYRRTNQGTLLGNLWRCMNRHWPIGHLVRHVLESEKSLSIFLHAPLISPCYINICRTDVDVSGTLWNQYETILRDPTSYKLEYRSIQTNVDDPNNCDRRDDILMSRFRFCTAEKVLRQTQGTDKLEVFPILNEETIYSCVMDPAKGTLTTKIYPPQPRQSVFPPGIDPEEWGIAK